MKIEREVLEMPKAFLTKSDTEEVVPVSLNYWRGYYNDLLIELSHWQFEKNAKGSVIGKSQKWYDKLIYEIKTIGNHIKHRENFIKYGKNFHG